MAQRPGMPAQAALAAAAVAAFLLLDDGAVLLQRLIAAPWTLGAPDRRPTGTWQGEATFPDAGTRTLTLVLALDELGDAEGHNRTAGGNGFFLRRMRTHRGDGPYLTGRLDIAGPGGADGYAVEGAVDRAGGRSTLNLHGADGRAGVLVEQATAIFAPPTVELTLRYRIPASGAAARGPGPVFSYVQAGTAWTAAAGPARVRLTRTAP